MFMTWFGRYRFHITVQIYEQSEQKDFRLSKHFFYTSLRKFISRILNNDCFWKIGYSKLKLRYSIRPILSKSFISQSIHSNGWIT